MYHIPTLLTLTRVFLVPTIITCMINKHRMLAGLLFAGASFTDVLDGMLARWLNQVTVFGTYLDPVADKILTLSIFTTLAIQGYISPIAVSVLWIKELLLVVAVIILYANKGLMPIVPLWIGKWAMFVQIAYLMLFFIGAFEWNHHQELVYYAIWMVVVIHLFSLFYYLIVGARLLFERSLKA